MNEISFASCDEALQLLANITHKKVIIADETEETETYDDMLDTLEKIEDHLHEIANETNVMRHLASKIGGSVGYLVNDQVQHNLFDRVMAFIDDEHQPGSVASLRKLVEKEKAKLGEQVSSGDEE
jgi:flagellar biosynthesis component FlhA